jgi:hypothetical protein
MRMRNVVVFSGAAILTYLAWLYGGRLWNARFVVNRTFDGGLNWYFYTWAYDALLLLVAGASVAFFVRSDRPRYWAAALGVLISALHLLGTRWILFDWSLDNIVWTVGRYVVPVITATLGGVIVERVARKSNVGV